MTTNNKKSSDKDQNETIVLLKEIPKDLQNIVMEYHQEIHTYINKRKKRVSIVNLPLYSVFA